MIRLISIQKRQIVIAVAVLGLLALTAGTVSAAVSKAKNIEAAGSVGFIGLAPGGTVGSDFKIAKKSADIESVKISTTGEIVSGVITSMITCEETSRHSEGACTAAGAILNGSGVLSTHASSVELEVTRQVASYIPGFIDIPVIRGVLKGSLEAELDVTGLNGEVLSGRANLKIRGSDLESAYGCLLGVDNDLVTLVWGSVQSCIDSPGPNALGHYLDPTAGPVMVPVELHVVDSGVFKVTSDSTQMKGKLNVTVDSDPLAGISGTISITKGVAVFAD